MSAPPAALATEAGLSKALSDVPLRSGYVELLGGYDKTVGAFARAEAGAHLAPNFGLFGFGQASTLGGMSAGVGARLNFNL